MPRWRKSIALVALFGLATASSAAGQSEHLTGCCVGGEMKPDPATAGQLEVFSMEFRDAAGVPRMQVVFRAGRASTQPDQSRVVDVIVSELVARDDQPDLTIIADGTASSVPGRLSSRRTISTTMTFDDFLRLSTARSVVLRAFGFELDFSSAQLQMLHSVAERWTVTAPR